MAVAGSDFTHRNLGMEWPLHPKIPRQNQWYRFSRQGQSLVELRHPLRFSARIFSPPISHT